MNKTVLILGSAGHIGSAAVQAFAAAGWRVFALARRAPAQPLPQGVQALTMSLDDPAAVAAAAHGASVVVYAVNPPYTRWDQELLPLFRQGMAIAEQLGARLMLPGNVYNFGETMPALLGADTPMLPSTAKGRLRCTMEAELRARPIDGVVIRAGDFYGHGKGSWFDQAIVKDIASGKLVYPGPPDRVHAWAYLPDLARAFVAVAEQPSPPHFQNLHFAGHSFTGAELLAAIDGAASALGLRPARGFSHGRLPWGLMKTLGVFVPMWRELARMSYLWRVPHALDGRSLENAVGRLAVTPPAEALRLALLDLGLGRSGPAGADKRALSSTA